MKTKVNMKYNLVSNSSELKSTNITLRDVLRVSNKEYIVVLSAMQLAELYDDEKIKYNVSTQRGIKIVKTKDGNREEPIHNNRNIKQMMELIKEGSLCNSFITLSVPEDGKQHIYYYQDGGLIIDRELSILDGFHRVYSCYRMYKYWQVLQEDELKHMLENTKFTVAIGSHSDNESKLIFSQLSKGLKLSKSKTESFDITKATNRIINKINKNSVLKGTIDTTRTSISKSDEVHIYSFSTFNEAMKTAFGTIQSETEERDVYEFLCVFFKELVSIFPELLDYESRRISKEYSFICQNFTIYGYLTLANDLYVKRFSGSWQDELRNIEKIDFDIDNDVWQPVVRRNGDDVKIVNNKQTRSLFGRILREQFYKVQN